MSGILPRPTLAVFRGTTLIAQNTVWSTSADATTIASSAAEIGAFPFPANSTDSALLLSLAPGLYTAQLSSADGSTGNALIEIYELP